ncbi:hypothetical protein SS50377_27688 [Spironucleus salmonicida]|uniref:Uncharacterized protein n=1 Tax=Spironucleus salmonicida TaxID=348837 RepID=V6LS67_9EUKA|nr:hypothetical protein SS50377_27688 [Spironucleus salmonicida]|eukprot:EST46536.1 Hypothetical protein SS50377_13341 [Spironucleus salmonicida]
MKCSTQFVILSKRTMRHIMLLNQTIQSKVATFALISPVLEQVPKHFSQPLNFQLQTLFQLTYSRLNNDLSPFLIIQTLSNAVTFFTQDISLDDQKQQVKLLLTNDIQSLFKLLQTRNTPQSQQILNSLQQNVPIQTVSDPVHLPVYQLIQKKLDPEFSKKLSNDPAIQYLYYLLIQLKQQKTYKLEEHSQANTQQSKFAKFFTQVLRFLQNPQPLEKLFDVISTTFTSEEERFVLFIALDAAVRTRQVSNLTNYTKVLIEIASLQAKSQLIDCLYILENAPQTLFQVYTEKLLNAKNYCFSILIQSGNLAQIYNEMANFANTIFPSTEQSKLLNMRMARLAEEDHNFFLAGHYSQLAGVSQSSDMLRNAIVGKIQEICGQQTSEVDLNGLEQFFSENDVPEARDDLVLAKDIHKLYGYIQYGCDAGNNEILNLAAITLQECPYEDIQQGIIRDLVYFNIISNNDSNQRNLITSAMKQSIGQDNTIQQAKRLLQSKKVNKVALNDFSVDQFFVSAANMSTSWRLEETADDKVMNWVLLQKFASDM